MYRVKDGRRVSLPQTPGGSLQPPPTIPFYPLHFLSPTHSNRVAASLSSYTNIPTEKGQKTIYPLLLTNLPPPPLLPPQGLHWGRKQYPASLFPFFASSLFFLPPISHNHNTHTQIRTYTHIQNEPTRSTVVHKVTNWGLCLLKRGWGNPYFVCTHTHTLSHPTLL